MGAIHFVLFKNNEFKIQKFGLFGSKNFDGIAKVKGDSIHLKYLDKKIDFQKILFPIKMKVVKNRIDTEFSNRPYHSILRELSK